MEKVLHFWRDGRAANRAKVKSKGNHGKDAGRFEVVFGYEEGEVRRSQRGCYFDKRVAEHVPDPGHEYEPHDDAKEGSDDGHVKKSGYDAPGRLLDGARPCGVEKDRKYYHGGTVVHEGLALDEGAECGGRAHLLEKRDHCDGIRCIDDGAK